MLLEAGQAACWQCLAGRGRSASVYATTASMLQAARPQTHTCHPPLCRTVAPLCPPTALCRLPPTRLRPAWSQLRSGQLWRAACGVCRQTTSTCCSYTGGCGGWGKELVPLVAAGSWLLTQTAVVLPTAEGCSWLLAALHTRLHLQHSCSPNPSFHSQPFHPVHPAGPTGTPPCLERISTRQISTMRRYPLMTRWRLWGS